MPYAQLADVVVLLHLAFVAFVVGGGFLIPRWPWLRWVHLPAALWGVLVEAAGLVCPLTPLERWLRLQSGSSASSGDFVGHYLLPILYPEHLTRPIQIALALGVIAVNLPAYIRLKSARPG